MSTTKKRILVIMFVLISILNISACGNKSTEGGPSGGTGTVGSGDYKDGERPLEIVDYGCTLSDKKNEVFVGMKIYNPNTELTVCYPKVTIEIKDSNNNTIATVNEHPPAIAPKETLHIGFSVSYDAENGQQGTHAEASVSYTSNQYQGDAQESYRQRYIPQEYIDIAVIESEVISDLYIDQTVTLTNNSEIDDYFDVIIIYYDEKGKITGGDRIAYIHANAGETTKDKVGAFFPNGVVPGKYELFGISTPDMTEI